MGSPTSTPPRPEMPTVLSEDPTPSTSLTAASRLSPTPLTTPTVMWPRLPTPGRLSTPLLPLVDMLVRAPMSTKPPSPPTTPRNSLHCVLSIFISYLLDTQYIQNYQI